MQTLCFLMLSLLLPDQPDSPVLTAEKAREQLAGTWGFAAAEERGKKVSVEENPKGIKDLKWVFKGDKLALLADGKGDEFEYKIDPTKSPKEIDLKLSFGGRPAISALCIYKLEGDQLTLCLGDKEGKARPTEFKTEQGSRFAIFVLKREAK